MSLDELRRTGPLSGIRVLDCATFLAAPIAASMMAEFGAEVIKVEQPGSGDPLRKLGTPTEVGDSLLWLSEARNKSSITLNLKDPEGAALFKRLVRDCDVVCENFRPGTMEAWGLGYETLAAINPRLILLQVSGFGQEGPYRDRPGFARIAHAFGGLSYLAGMPGEVPVTPGSTSLADYMSGAYGAYAIMVALRERDLSGKGQAIDIALYEPVFRALDELAPAYARDGTVRGRQGVMTSIACPHGHFECADGEWVAIACTNDKMFARLCAAMDQSQLCAPDRFGPVAKRLEHSDEVEGVVARWTVSADRDAILARLIEGEVPCAPVNSIRDIVDDPHIKSRQTLKTLRDKDLDEIPVPNVVPRLSRSPGRVESLGPRLGADNDLIYGEWLGLSEEELVELAERGVI